MAKIIGLPKLSPTMEEGTLVRWVKQEGDTIEVDDLIAEVETDKATMEFRSFDKGVLLKQLAAEGETLKPDQPVAVIGKKGDDVEGLLAKAGAAPANQKTKSSAEADAEAAEGREDAAGSEDQAVEGEASDSGEDAGEEDAGEGDAGEDDAGEEDAGEEDAGEEDAGEEDAGEAAQARPTQKAAKPANRNASQKKADAPAKKAAAPSATDDSQDAEPSAEASEANGQDGGRIMASPAVRRIARERELDLSQVRGSGPGGRVIKRDVETSDTRVGLPGTALRGPSAPPSAGKAPAQAPRPTASAAPNAKLGEGRLEKLSPMHKTIARRLTESKQTVPHFYLTIDIDAGALVAARAQINADLEASGEKVSLNDLLIKACAVALRRVPKVNASFQGENILFHDRVDISVAVAIPDGLVTPVVRNADQLGVLAIARQVKDLAARAKEKKLKPEEMSNGTFSVSNLGMFGIDDFSAVINPPEGAILAISALRDEPVVKDGQVVPGKRLALTMSCDHRVIDGALGAEWLKVLRGLLESPLRMIV